MGFDFEGRSKWTLGFQLGNGGRTEAGPEENFVHGWVMVEDWNLVDSMEDTGSRDDRASYQCWLLHGQTTVLVRLLSKCA